MHTAPLKKGIWYFPRGKFHTILGAQEEMLKEGAVIQGRMKTSCFWQIKSFISPHMAHPVPWLRAAAGLGCCIAHAGWFTAMFAFGDLSISITRDLSLKAGALKGRKRPLLPCEPSGYIQSFCLCDTRRWSWITKGIRHWWRALCLAWKTVLHRKCRIASFNPLTLSLRVSDTVAIWKSAIRQCLKVCLGPSHTKPVFTSTFEASISTANTGCVKRALSAAWQREQRRATGLQVNHALCHAPNAVQMCSSLRSIAMQHVASHRRDMRCNP